MIPTTHLYLRFIHYVFHCREAIATVVAIAHRSPSIEAVDNTECKRCRASRLQTANRNYRMMQTLVRIKRTASTRSLSERNAF